MAPKDLYQDDGTLSNFLDGLIQSATEDRAEVLGGEPPLSNAESRVDPERLVQGISVANDLIREGGQCRPLPLLTENNENVENVLAAALSAITRLSRCCEANVSLRVDAEKRFQAAQGDADRLLRVLQVAKDDIAKKESDLVGAKNKLRETDVKGKRKAAKLTAENNALKSRVAAAEGQINHLHLEAKKRERQYTHLQQRVHSLMSNSRKSSIEPAITRGEGHKASGTHGLSRSNKKGDSDADDDGNMRMDAAGLLLSENTSFRRLLHSIQLEMDDMIGSYTSAFQFLRLQDEGADETSELSDSDAETSSMFPASALSLERMHLPFEMIRDDVEGLIDEKFAVIRKALEQVEQT